MSLRQLCIPVAIALALASVTSTARAAAPRLEKIAETHRLDVCIWPEYYGISFRNPRSGTVTGLDADMARKLALALGAQLKLVDSSFTHFMDDLESARCDVAMMAVGMTAERARRVAFTMPYLRSDVYAVTLLHSALIKSWKDIDQKGVRVGVSAGTFHEPLMRRILRHAELVVVQPPTSRESELEAGRIDVFMSDFPFTRKLVDNLDWVKIISPPKNYHPVDYAYALPKDDPAWQARLDRFIEQALSDGTLRGFATRYGLEPIVIDHRP